MSGAVLVLVAWLLGVAVVTLSIVAKLIDWAATGAAWPIGSPRLRRVLGPGPVVAAEGLVVAVGLVPVGTAFRLLVLAALYAAYAVAGIVLRGRPCGCFGSTFVTRFGAAHVAACAAGAAVLAVGAATAPPALPATVAAAVGAAAGALTAAAARRGRQRARRRATDPARLALVDHVVVYGSTGCPGCRGVWAQREQLAAMSGYPVEFRLIEEKQAMAQAGGAIPAAIGYDAGGAAVFGPVAGLAAIRALLTAPVRHPVSR